ncbi:hypothetical protein BOTBODRAFT_36956 [Botryobasidium botryosum FD-172 SS1]|uniref:Uncharacterized protein n=1 Tax=Botryobasidium botryosum (strain FD-172 SS1) TaxID=930990 RepID=A0A067M1V4_BOTB1|nr:hypothetical protein BOTBODRAFT_36956 [Botryobasidium botryosum FD-172 SS1]
MVPLSPTPPPHSGCRAQFQCPLRCSAPLYSRPIAYPSNERRLIALKHKPAQRNHSHWSTVRACTCDFFQILQQIPLFALVASGNLRAFRASLYTRPTYYTLIPTARPKPDEIA